MTSPPHTNSGDIAAISVYSIVQLLFRTAQTKFCHLISHNVTFIDIISFIPSVGMSFMLHDCSIKSNIFYIQRSYYNKFNLYYG